MITLRRARIADAVSIGAVHVAAWRSAYPGILPDEYLAGLSLSRHAAHYERAIRAGAGVHVAIASGFDLGSRGGVPLVVGFVTGAPARSEARLAEGEIETLYVLDDWRERGIGRRLMHCAAGHLAEAGCASAFLWVLRDNPSRWFYERLGGRAAAESTIQVAGQAVGQTAYVWSPIARLAQATSSAS
ncbi:MAG: GNAT family N-acetyltransferase [Rhodospirillales bacterium]|nr:GNAT family N-acetyltransferase [Rhodospirillales bacterium]MDE2198559.1 GNAT family N-acetyltransferase [Rhodospirillales bacterium]MDE2575199.1 GNAT family N-acetyltransferase [Rhodospirillales bacterium]